jgi:hypothetical protein
MARALRPPVLAVVVCAMCCATALLLAPPARAREVDIAVLAPGCLEPWQRVLLFAAMLTGPVVERGGSLAIVASGPTALAAPDRVAFPDPRAATSAPLSSIPTSIAEAGSTVLLETPFERVLVLDDRGGEPGAPDLLGLLEELAQRSGGRFPDVERREVPLLRGGGVVALALAPVPPEEATEEAPEEAPEETAEEPPPVRHAGATRRETVATFEVQLGARRATLVTISRSLGGPARIYQELRARPAGIVLHGGGLRTAACARAVAALGVHAIAPRSADLAGDEREAALPFVAANLKRLDGERPWPPFRTYTFDGEGEGADARPIRVAVVGLVGSGELRRSSQQARARFSLSSGRDALAEAVAELRRDAAGPPDVIVALSSGDGAERAQLVGVDGIDLVVADFSRDDGLAVEMAVFPQTPRERARHNAAVMPVFHRAGLGRVRLSFEEAAAGEPADGAVGAGRASLRGIHVEIDPLLDRGAALEAPPAAPPEGREEPRARTTERERSAAAAALARPLREEEDARALGGGVVLLPAVRELAAEAGAAPLLWGERLSIFGEIRRRAPGELPIWTDDLWLRMVGHTALAASGADLVLVRNMRRAGLVAGPLSRATVDAWLQDTGQLLFVELTGVELARLAERLAATPAPFDDSSGVIAVAGIDAERKIVGGRPIEPLATYRVAVDERLAGEAQLQGFLDAPRIIERRELRAVVVEGLLADPEPRAWLLDRAHERRPEWRLGVQALELRGSAVRTSPGLLSLAPSLETRAQQRDLLLTSARLHAFALYDGPALAWDNQLRLQYDATFFGDGGPGPAVIEPFDDVVFTTELRAHAARFQLAADALTLSPFVNATLDGEVTPAPGFRRQAQLRQVAGVALVAGGVVREVRLGVVLQEDASELFEPPGGGAGAGTVFFDAGFLALLHLNAPLGGTVTLDSVSDARFFVVDPQDRPFDLALRAQSVTRLSAPVTGATSGFLFLDVVALSPKHAPAAVEWNAIVGAGLAFAGVWRL